MRNIKREDLPECKGYDCNCATEGYSLDMCVLYWKGKCASPIWDEPEPELNEEAKKAIRETNEGFGLTKCPEPELNEETAQAIEETRQGIGLIKCKDIDDLFKRLGIEKT